MNGIGAEGKHNGTSGVMKEKSREVKEIQFAKEEEENRNILYCDYKIEYNILHKTSVYLLRFNQSSYFSSS